MYYKDTGFRALYKNFIVFPLKDSLKRCIEDYPGADKANCILTYGYIDHEAGLTMEILAAGIKDGGGFTFFDTSSEVKAMIRVGSVIEDEFFIIDDEDGSLSRRYSEKLEILEDYAVSDEIEETRKMAFLDKSRHEYYPDDVMVYLIKEGLNPEGCWVRLTGLGDHFFKGKLLNEPYFDFGCRSGDAINFFAQKPQNGDIILFADMT